MFKNNKRLTMAIIIVNLCTALLLLLTSPIMANANPFYTTLTRGGESIPCLEKNACKLIVARYNGNLKVVVHTNDSRCHRINSFVLEETHLPMFNDYFIIEKDKWIPIQPTTMKSWECVAGVRASLG
jgi:hypothetical protein